MLCAAKRLSSSSAQSVWTDCACSHQSAVLLHDVVIHIVMAVPWQRMRLFYDNN